MKNVFIILHHPKPKTSPTQEGKPLEPPVFQQLNVTWEMQKRCVYIQVCWCML